MSHEKDHSNSTRPPKRPWLDGGKFLSDKKLRKVSHKWSPRIWEEYLKTLEVPQTELLHDEFEQLLHQHDASVVLTDYNEDQSSCDERLFVSQAAMRKACLTLTHRQRKMVELVYFSGMSAAAAGRTLGVSPRPAQRILQRALTRLKDHLCNRIESYQ